MEQKRLLRSESDRLIAGVCGGLGKYFEADPIIFRALFVLLALSGGAGIVLYIFLAILLPLEGTEGEVRGGIPEDLASRAKVMAEEIKTRHLSHRHRGRSTLGLIVILLGAFILLNQIFPSRIPWDLLLPAGLILLGLLLVFRNPAE